MIKLCRAGVVALFCAFFCACETPARKPDTVQAPAGLERLDEQQRARYQQATQAMANADYANALAKLQPLVKSHPAVAEIALNKAISEYHLGDFAACASTLAPVLTLPAPPPAAHNLAGLLAVKKGEFAAAKNHYERALGAEPDYINALYNQALLHDIYLQNATAALPYYKRYLALVADDQATAGWVDQLQSSLGE